MEVAIPYGDSAMQCHIPEGVTVAVLTPEGQMHVHREEGVNLVARAMSNPIDAPPLRTLAKGTDRVVIIASDHTRPVPSKILAPAMLREIREGNPEADITFLIATGFHRTTTREELIHKFGEEIIQKEKIVVHDSMDSNALVDIGVLPSGGRLLVNRLAAEAELLIAEGFIEPHVFAGYSGGRKSVLPGIAGRTTVMANHCAEFIDHPRAKPGYLGGNPMHEDMVYACRAVSLRYILNVALDEGRNIVGAWAGDVESAHLEGCRFVEQMVGVQADLADIVITTNYGYPLDQNVYQHVKCLSTAECICREGGVIIACAELRDGHGSEDMYEQLSIGAQKAMAAIRGVARDQTKPDQWATQIMARILLRHRVIFVSGAEHHTMLRQMGFETAETPDAALQMALGEVGKHPAVAVIPDGVGIIIKERGGKA